MPNILIFEETKVSRKLCCGGDILLRRGNGKHESSHLDKVYKLNNYYPLKRSIPIIHTIIGNPICSLREKIYIN